MLLADTSYQGTEEVSHCSHVSVAPSERHVLYGLPLFSHIFVMSNEASRSQVESLSSIYICSVPGRETRGQSDSCTPQLTPSQGISSEHLRQTNVSGSGQSAIGTPEQPNRIIEHAGLEETHQDH